MKNNLYALLIVSISLISLTISCNNQTKKENKPKSGFIDIGKCKIHYEMQGEGIPLILIHAGYVDMRMWDGQFNEFAKHFKVIRYDARQHGLSISKPDTFSHYEDLNLLMNNLHIPKAVILGLSMGGYVTTDFAIAYPEKVIALIPVSPGLSGYEFKDKFFLSNVAKMQKAESIPEAVEYFQRSWTDGPYRTPDQIDSVIRNKAKRMYTQCFTNMRDSIYETQLDPPAVNRLSEIDVPTLVIVGDKDVSDILEISDIILRNVKNSNKITIKGSAHLVNMEKPDEFNKIVIDFISNLKIK